MAATFRSKKNRIKVRNLDTVNYYYYLKQKRLNFFTYSVCTFRLLQTKRL